MGKNEAWRSLLMFSASLYIYDRRAPTKLTDEIGFSGTSFRKFLMKIFAFLMRFEPFQRHHRRTHAPRTRLKKNQAPGSSQSRDLAMVKRRYRFPKTNKKSKKLGIPLDTHCMDPRISSKVFFPELKIRPPDWIFQKKITKF